MEMLLTTILLYVILEMKPVVLKFDLMRAPFCELTIWLLVNWGAVRVCY